MDEIRDAIGRAISGMQDPIKLLERTEQVELLGICYLIFEQIDIIAIRGNADGRRVHLLALQKNLTQYEPTDSATASTKVRAEGLVELALALTTI